MKSYVVSEKILNKVMVALYNRVIEQDSGKVLDLNRFKFDAYDRDIQVLVPEVVDARKSIPKLNYPAYIIRMEELNFIKRDGMTFVFTDFGFIQASKLACPIKTLVKSHWGVLSSLAIGIVALIVTIIQLS
ncbi:hypothetical protein [Aliivibrio fischeri]|uniref:hypothetical protein n=1 Tax=Aliivibrio fischeri TaxID=668 RepID=UPI001F254F42|nr:hypothetical protein [Aliivibrio fischeri]MCE4937453.1 hypothetical protein [Aliivibrio fischeri]